MLDDDLILDDDDEGEDEDFESKVTAAVAGRGRPGSAPRSRPQTASRSRAGSAERERQPALAVSSNGDSTNMPAQGLGPSPVAPSRGLGPGPAPPSRPSSAYIPDEQHAGAHQRTRPASASAAEPAASGQRPATLAAKRGPPAGTGASSTAANQAARPKPPRPQAQMAEDLQLTEEIRAVFDVRPSSSHSKITSSTSPGHSRPSSAAGHGQGGPGSRPSSGGSRPFSAGSYGQSRPSSANLGASTGLAEPDESLPPQVAYPGRLLGTTAAPAEPMVGRLRPQQRSASSSSLHEGRSSGSDPAGGATSTTRPPRPKSSQHYMRERRERLKRREEDMANSIEQGGREVLYRHLYRMGEANEWAEQLGLSTRFRAFKTKEGVITCHVYEDRQFERELSLELFEKRYGTLKGRWNTVIAFKPEHEEDSKSPKKPDPAATDMTQKGPTLTRDEQEQRQQEIRAALLNTIHLTQTLKEQLKILDKRAPSLTPFVIE